MGLNGQPWCMSFVQWVFAKAGASDLLPAKTGSCGALMRAAKSAGLWVDSGCRPGDVVIYDFPGGAATDHCGIVVTPLTNGIRSIEGNTAAGNDSNGGEVMERTRPNAYILGAVRPDYSMEQEEDDMDIDKLTDAQLVRLAERMQAALVNRPISDKLRSELDEAVALGITDGVGPNKFCTRAQAAVMAKRAIKK